jgi:hypothetical protein
MIPYHAVHLTRTGNPKCTHQGQPGLFLYLTVIYYLHMPDVFRPKSRRSILGSHQQVFRYGR